MVTLKVAAGWLELAAGTLTLEVRNPFFEADTVPGTLSYPFGLPMSAANVTRLNFPHLRADQGQVVAPEPAQLYVDGVLLRVGSLVYLSCDEEKQLYACNFLADAADLASRIDGVLLPTLDLGTVALTLNYDAADYALPCLRNDLFYDKEKVPDYKGIVNYYRGGSYLQATSDKQAPVVPFLRLVPLLRRVLACFGYALSGPWLDSSEVQQLVLYSDRAAEDATGALPARISLNRYVPAISVGELLLSLQKLFGLAYSFHPVRRELHVATLASVLADPAYVARAGAGPARTTAVVDAGGWALEMALESDDELNKTLDVGWAKYTVGAGKQALSTSAGTLHVVREADPLDAGRQWLVPAVAAKGASPYGGGGDDSRCGLRLLYDRGLHADSQGNTYPLATWGTQNYAGQTVGTSSLHWDGSAGLYAQGHATWLAFLDAATTKERTLPFTVADLLSLDPARKELVDQRKYLWQTVSLKISTTGRVPLQAADYTYRYTRL